MKTDLELAFEAWQKLLPTGRRVEATIYLAKDEITKAVSRRRIPEHYEGNCCHNIHFYKTQDGGSLKPLPDDKVCARERAWRTYVIIRDGKH